MNRLFHLHFHVPDVRFAERSLDSFGVPLNARYGVLDDESVRLAPDDPVPDGFRFRLQDHQTGHVNVTLTRGPRLRFDHLGVVTDEFDDVLDRARDAGWNVLPNERRTFLVTPWGFRVEVHPTGGRIDDGLGDAATGRIEQCDLEVSDGKTVRNELKAVLGSLGPLRVRDAGDAVDGDDAVRVPAVTLAGRAFDGTVPLRTTELVEN